MEIVQGGTEKDRPAICWNRWFKRVGLRLRKIRVSLRLRRYDESHTGHKVVDSMLPGKSSCIFTLVTVPQTDTGRLVEYTKALERTLVKELGKIAP